MPLRGRPSSFTRMSAITSALVLGQRRTLEPDQVEIARRDGRQSQPAVMLVDDVIALTDGTRGVRLYHAPNSRPHGTNDSSRTGSFGCWRMIGTG
jgi:hypothetical protein